MKTPHVLSASAAAVLAMTMAAFAHSPQPAEPPSQAQPPSQSQPASQSQPQTPSAQPQSPATPQSGAAQSSARQPETPVTLVGCIQRESEYRKANSSGRGGPAATGVGLGNEFVLVNATKSSAGTPPSSAAADCSSTSAGAGEAYELTGSREPEIAKFVGRRVEITGVLKEAKTEAGRPTGGFDPLKQDLKLFEVEVKSFRELPAQSAAAAPEPASPPPAAAPAPEPAPAPRQAAPAPPPSQPQPEPQPRQTLPRTASPLPLTGLLGALSMALGLGLRRRRL